MQVAFRPESNLFNPVTIDTSIVSSSWQELTSRTGLDNELGAIEFKIEANETSVLHLSESFIYVRACVCQADGSYPPATAKVMPVNSLLSSLFSSVEVYGNDQLLTTNNNFAYKGFLECLLNSSVDWRDSLGKLRGYYEDINPSILTDANPAAKARKELCQAGDIELCGSLPFDLGQIDEYLPSQVALRIRLLRNTNPFLLITDVVAEQTSYKLKIKECVLSIRRHVLLPSLMQRNHNLLMRSGLIKLPFKRTNLKSYVVSKDTTLHTYDNIVSGSAMPDRLVIFMVKNEDVNGQYKSNPFVLDHFSLNTLSVVASNDLFRYPVIRVDFANKRKALAYYHLFLGGDANTSLNGPGISYDQWFKGESVCFIIDVKDSKASNIPSALRLGSIKVELQFAKALEQTINVFVYTETSQLLTIDSMYNLAIADIETTQIL